MNQGELRIPLPRPTPVSRPFWEGARRGELLVQKCRDCGNLVHIPHVACTRCLSPNLEWVQSSGKGTVYSYVVAHYPQVPSFDYPLPIGLIELEEGTRLVADLVGVDPADVKVGMAVTVEWQDHDDELTLPAFKPAG